MFNFLSIYQDNRHHYIIVCVLYPVCSSAGSLGCLAYTGGPLVKCSCVGDDQTIMLPYVSYSPDSDDNGSPETHLCMCKCNHREFNVDEVLKQQVSWFTEQSVITIGYYYSSGHSIRLPAIQSIPARNCH